MKPNKGYYENVPLCNSQNCAVVVQQKLGLMLINISASIGTSRINCTLQPITMLYGCQQRGEKMINTGMFQFN